MGTLKRAVIVTAIALAFSGVIGTGQSLAMVPWWHLNTVSSPAAKAGERSIVIVEAANLGGGCVDECKLFTKLFGGPYVTFTDTLPAGVTPTAVHLESAGPAALQLPQVFSSCSLTGQTATCTYDGPLQSYERLEMIFYVNVAPGAGSGLNEASISGGSAAPVVSRRALALDSVPSYGVETYELTPEEEGGAPDTQAGSHPLQLTTTLTFNTDVVNTGFDQFIGEDYLDVRPLGLTKDLRFDIPPGLVGNPTPLPKCSVQAFLALVGSGNLCANDMVVGTATPIIASIGALSGTPRIPGALVFPLYSLQPSVGEPARFGFNTPLGPVMLDTSVRTGGDYGVVVTVPDIITAASFIGTQLSFWGVPADPRHDAARGTCLYPFKINSETLTVEKESCGTQEKPQPFLIMPTSCTGPLHTTIEGDPWEHVGQFASKEYTFANNAGEPYGLDGCNRLSFEPSVSFTPDGQQGSTPTGLTVGIHVSQESELNPKGLADSTVRDTTVALPAGVAINPAGADGLQACSLAQVGLEEHGEQTCPESSKIGTVEIETPLLPHRLEGAAYLAQQYANPFGSLIAMYIVVKDPYSGVIVKLAGQVSPDPVTGQLTATFKDTPQLPFENLWLHFFGGSRAPLGTPAYCGPYTTTASIAPWSGNSPVDSSSTFEITSGPDHTPCSNPLPFKPELTTGSLNIQAGAFTPFAMTMSRDDGNQNLQGIKLQMPPGLLGEISKTTLCGEAEANAGTCGPESLIGETTVSVGLGGNPYTVKGGKVYITGPYAGAPYGLSIVNPAKAGPFDLGQVVVRAKIEVNPTNAAITITSDTTGPYRIPQIIDGIPLQIKHVNVTITRPEFTFNPTDCEPQQIGGALTSTEGASSVLHVPFQVTNCAVLGFKPIFKVSTSGKTSRANGASLDVKLTYPKAPFGSQANIGKVKVDLPKQLPSRLTTLQKACPDSTFNANPAACPAASRIGSATATTPVLPVHLEGPAYFVSHGGQKFPELIIALSGQGVTVYLHGETFISPAGITSSTFRTIPDVPIGVFELNLPQGPGSALAANGNLCTATLKMPTTFVAANGMTIHQSTPITASGCGKKKGKKASGRHKGTGHGKKK
jgi:hypothetical protein